MPSYLLPRGMLLPQHLARAVLTLMSAGLEEHRYGIGPDVEQFVRDLKELANTEPAAPPAEPVVRINVCDAARLLGLSRRQTCALASRLGGRKIGGRWMLDGALVVEESAARSAADGGQQIAVVA